MAGSRTSNVILNSGASMMYKASNMLMQFVLRTAFIKLLGREYTGISSLFTDVLQVLSLMELGIVSALTYALYKPIAEKDHEKVSALMHFYKIAYRLIGCMVLVIGLLCTPFLDYIVKDVPNIKEDIRLIFIMYLVSTASSYFLVYKTTLLRATQQARIISAVNSVAEVVEGVIEVVLLLIFKEYFAYLIVRLVGVWTRNIILSVKTERICAEFLSASSARLTKAETKSLFRDIFALGIYKVSGVVIYSSSSIMISAFINTATVAVMGNYNMIVNSVRTTIEQVVDATKPSVGNLAATSSSTHQKAIFDRMNFIAFAVACLCCTCFCVLLSPFIGNIWFDSSYLLGPEIVVVLAVNFFIAVMVYPVETFRTANGLFVQGKWRPAIMAVLNILLSILFVQWWGLLGILLATTVSRLSTQVWFDAYLVYKHVFHKKPWAYYGEYLLQAFITAISCGAACWLAGIAVSANIYLSFLYKMLVAVLVPLIILFALYHKDERMKAIWGMGKKMIRKVLKKTASR